MTNRNDSYHTLFPREKQQHRHNEIERNLNTMRQSLFGVLRAFSVQRVY